MKILIAPDKFKGSLGASDVASNIATGVCEILPEAQITKTPMADGGEGTAEIISDSLGGIRIKCDAHDPLGRPIKARVGWIEAKKLVVMEMNEAAGLRLLKPNERDPMRANTFGVGEMLLCAAKHGAQEIIIGLGGSATNDGGSGLARALGYRFRNASGNDLGSAPEELIHLEKIVPPENLMLPPMVVAADVRNPLLGERGATRTFGPQKGATAKQLDLLENALMRLADVAARDLGKDLRDKPGAGAAGGLGFGLMTFCGATMRSGFDVVAEKIQLEKAIGEADVVITGEGSLDRQTLEGKVPAGAARLAHKQDKRVFAIVGKSNGDREVEALFEKVFALADESKTESDSIKRAAELLRACGRKLAGTL